MALLKAIYDNLTDIRTLGLGFSLRHLSLLTRHKLHTFTIPGLGKVAIRPGTTDASVVRQIFKNGEYDLSKVGWKGWGLEKIVASYEAMLEKGRTPLIIDAGANIGMAALWFARQFPLAAIIAIEPEPDNAAMLRLNLAHHSKLNAVEAAIGAVSGYITLSNPAGQAWSPRSQRSRDSGGIKIVTIPELVASVPNADLLFVKIDIEGFESDLFATDLDWLNEVRAVMIEIHDWMMPGRRTSRMLQRAMGERDFEMIINGENLVYINCASYTAKE